MGGIGKEAAVFLYAVLSGIVLYSSYQVLYWLRKLIPHAAWIISIEDLLFWIGVSIYLFRQMYRTTYGEIRWFFLVGVIGGSILASGIFKFPGKIKRKCQKHLEKQNENR